MRISLTPGGSGGGAFAPRACSSATYASWPRAASSAAVPVSERPPARTSKNPRRVRSMAASFGRGAIVPQAGGTSNTISCGPGRARLRGTMALRTPGRRRVALALTAVLGAATLTAAQPNPYRTVEGWAKMPDGRVWGATSAVEIDPDGRSVWVAERCGANDCVESRLDPVLRFDAEGTLVKSFGAGYILSPHGIFVGRDGSVWVTDCACTGRGRPYSTENKKGHQVFKFSRDGTLLMTLGAAGGGTG